jgi:hypothetical protein
LTEALDAPLNPESPHPHPLVEGDLVELDWNHDYVTAHSGCSSPDRPVTKLRMLQAIGSLDGQFETTGKKSLEHARRVGPIN